MSAALELYAQLTEAPDEKTRARLIADAFDALKGARCESVAGFQVLS